MEMQKAEHNEQLGIFTLGFGLAIVTHVRRFVQREPNHQAPYGRFLPDGFGLDPGGAIAESIGGVPEPTSKRHISSLVEWKWKRKWMHRIAPVAM